MKILFFKFLPDWIFGLGVTYCAHGHWDLGINIGAVGMLITIGKDHLK